MDNQVALGLFITLVLILVLIGLFGPPGTFIPALFILAIPIVVFAFYANTNIGIAALVAVGVVAGLLLLFMKKPRRKKVKPNEKTLPFVPRKKSARKESKHDQQSSGTIRLIQERIDSLVEEGIEDSTANDIVGRTITLTDEEWEIRKSALLGEIQRSAAEDDEQGWGRI